MLDLARVKAFLKFEEGEDSGEDPLIQSLLDAAIGMVERATGHLLTSREVVEPVSARRFASSGIRLFKAPVTEVTAIAYPGADGAPVAIEDWQLVEGSDSWLLPAWGEAWPALGIGEAMTVTYTAGYPNEQVPADLEQAIVCLAAHFYHHRDDMTSIPGVVDAMLGPYRPLGIA